MDIKEYMQTVGRQARAASRRMATASTAEKNAALLHIAAFLNEARALADIGTMVYPAMPDAGSDFAAEVEADIRSHPHLMSTAATW